MDITEKSKEYAKGVSLEAITSAIEKAYADGFNAGMDYQANKKVIDAETGVTYVDLGLPSGTLWASDYVRKDSAAQLFLYTEASNLNIPSLEQYEELRRECDYEFFSDRVSFTGKNGKSIEISYCFIRRYSDVFKNTFVFWLKSKKGFCTVAYVERTVDFFNTFNVFMGHRMPVLLVK